MFRAWTPGDAMDSGVWGIAEPKADKPALDPDILLMPLLAFDRQGWRLGYGGGFYDRTLQGLRARKAVVAVGLGYDEQEVDAVPHLDYDQRLDWVLTPSGPLKCPAKARIEAACACCSSEMWSAARAARRFSASFPSCARATSSIS